MIYIYIYVISEKNETEKAKKKYVLYYYILDERKLFDLRELK